MLNDPQLKIDQHLHAVEAIVAGGGTEPAEHRKLAAAWVTARSGSSKPRQQAFVDALLNGDIGNLEQLRLEAALESLARTNNQAWAAPIVAAAPTVLTALRQAYATAAHDNYAKASKAFTSHVTALVKARAVVDPTSSPESLLHASPAIREAWSNAAVAAAGLDDTAAQLQRTAAMVTGHTSEAALVGLTVDATGLHRRRVWEAWDLGTARWNALLAMGATLRAASLDTAAPYERPGDPQITYERSSLGMRRVDIDPADVEFAQSRGQLAHAASARGTSDTPGAKG